MKLRNSSRGSDKFSFCKTEVHHEKQFTLLPRGWVLFTLTNQSTQQETINKTGNKETGGVLA